MTYQAKVTAGKEFESLKEQIIPYVQKTLMADKDLTLIFDVKESLRDVSILGLTEDMNMPVDVFLALNEIEKTCKELFELCTEAMGKRSFSVYFSYRDIKVLVPALTPLEKVRILSNG